MAKILTTGILGALKNFIQNNLTADIFLGKKAVTKINVQSNPTDIQEASKPVYSMNINVEESDNTLNFTFSSFNLLGPTGPIGPNLGTYYIDKNTKNITNRKKAIADGRFEEIDENNIKYIQYNGCGKKGPMGLSIAELALGLNIDTVTTFAKKVHEEEININSENNKTTIRNYIQENFPEKIGGSRIGPTGPAEPSLIGNPQPPEFSNNTTSNRITYDNEGTLNFDIS